MKKDHGMNIIWLFLLFVFYMLYGIVGSSWYGFYIFAAFGAIPLGVYVFKRGMNYYLLAIVALLTGIVGVLFHPAGALIFFVMLMIPGFSYGMYERTKHHILSSIVLNGIIYFIGMMMIFGIFTSVFQIDISRAYNELVEEVETQALMILDEQEPLVIAQAEEDQKDQMEEAYRLLRIKMKEGFYYMQYLFPGLLFLLCFGFGFFQCLMSKLIITGMGWKEFQWSGLVNFGITPIIPIALAITWFWRQSVDEQVQPLLSRASTNVLFVFSILLFILGVLSILHMIRTMKTGIGVKIILTTLSIMGIFVTPLMNMYIILGFFDGIFNFRKVERVI